MTGGTTEVDPFDLTDDQSAEVARIVLRDEFARAYDPDAFEDHPVERRSKFASIQWAARRHLALEAADRLMPWLERHDLENASRALTEAADEYHEPHDPSTYAPADWMAARAAQLNLEGTATLGGARG